MTEKALPVIVVDDEPSAGMIISRILADHGYSVKTFSNAEDALHHFQTDKSKAVLFLDIFLPGQDGMSALPKFIQLNPHLRVVMMTAYQTVESIVNAMKAGAVDFLIKPLNPDMVLQAVQKYADAPAVAYAEQEKPAEVAAPSAKSKTPEFLVFTPALKSLLSVAEKFASSDETVLILGESGTGKELLANYIHHKSPRKNKPFIVVDCASIPESLFESEMFGYEKGAFTGAETSKAGRFELANGGTLFLDEIGNVPLSMQSKLLRFTQDHMISRLGGKKTMPLDIRLIAATNADLQKHAKSGTFREDLYYRISALTLNLPPLRNRPKEEKEALVNHFLAAHARKLNIPVPKLSDPAHELIMNYSWPGNVREMEHALHSAVLLSSSGVVEVASFPIGIQSYVGHRELPTSAAPRASEMKETTLRDILRKVEKEQILSAIKQTAGNKKKAAEMLNIDYKNFLKKLKEYTQPD